MVKMPAVARVSGLSVSSVESIALLVFSNLRASINGELPTSAALGAALVGHWHQHSILDIPHGILVVRDLAERVTRYAVELDSVVISGQAESIPVMTVEIADSRWVRAKNYLYDVKNKQRVTRIETMPTFSHSVALSALFLEMHPLEMVSDAAGVSGKTKTS